jgi:hypothetical protein
MRDATEKQSSELEAIETREWLESLDYVLERGDAERIGRLLRELNIHVYNKRGTAEQWIKEGKLAVSWTRLSCHRFRGNEVRLWLSVIAYNLGTLWRRLALPRKIRNWSLTSLQQRLVKTGGRLVKHARYYWLLLAEGHLNRRLFGSMLRMIAALPLPDG